MGVCFCDGAREGVCVCVCVRVRVCVNCCIFTSTVFPFNMKLSLFLSTWSGCVLNVCTGGGISAPLNPSLYFQRKVRYKTAGQSCHLHGRFSERIKEHYLCASKALCLLVPLSSPLHASTSMHPPCLHTNTSCTPASQDVKSRVLCFLFL